MEPEIKKFKGPFEELSLEARKQVPIVYPSLQQTEGVFLYPTESKHHRTTAYYVQIFHRPVSLSIDYDKARSK